MAYPIDSIQWIPFDRIRPNGYNPNSQTADNHKILPESITADGWTKAPVVTPPDAESIHHHRRREMRTERPPRFFKTSSGSRLCVKCAASTMVPINGEEMTW